jgi:hypothetical protein
MARNGLIIALLIVVLAGRGVAGGPLLVTGKAFNNPGSPLLWPASSPVSYRTPNAGALGKLDNAHAVERVQQLFKIWEDVPTASIQIHNAGAIQPTGPYQGGAIDSPAKFDAVVRSCEQGVQTPIMFDANGRLFDQLFGTDSGIIGLAGPCDWDNFGILLSALAFLNGAWIDGNVANGELTDAQFDEAFVHEFGHLLGLDHSQISVEVLTQPPDHCDRDLLAPLPIMFPFAHCQARPDAGLPMLSEDDQAWISKLYPESVDDPPNRVPFNKVYGVISGNVLFGDGETLAQGVNVLAEDAEGDNSRSFSVVSGYLFTGNPGQQVSGDNPGDRLFGSHDPSVIGKYDVPVRAGSYGLRVESIFFGFWGGSGVGPLFPMPIPGGTPPPGPIKVAAGAHVDGIDITLTNQQPRFDQFEGR